MNGSTIERKVLWGFGLALLFVCGLAVLTYFAERNVRDATLAASRTQHLLLQIANLRYRFSASEAHQRAFLISREPRTLRPGPGDGAAADHAVPAHTRGRRRTAGRRCWRPTTSPMPPSSGRKT